MGWEKALQGEKTSHVIPLAWKKYLVYLGT